MLIINVDKENFNIVAQSGCSLVSIKSIAQKATSKKFDNLPPEPIGPSFIQQYASQVESHFDDTDFEVIS